MKKFLIGLGALLLISFNAFSVSSLTIKNKTNASLYVWGRKLKVALLVPFCKDISFQVPAGKEVTKKARCPLGYMWVSIADGPYQGAHASRHFLIGDSGSFEVSRNKGNVIIQMIKHK